MGLKAIQVCMYLQTVDERASFLGRSDLRQRFDTEATSDHISLNGRSRSGSCTFVRPEVPQPILAMKIPLMSMTLRSAQAKWGDPKGAYLERFQIH